MGGCGTFCKPVYFIVQEEVWHKQGFLAIEIDELCEM